MPTFTKTAYFGDRYTIVGDGVADDTVAAQQEIKYAANNSIELIIPDGMVMRTTAALSLGPWTRIRGRGGYLQKNNSNPNAVGKYTGFLFDHRGVGLSSVASGNNFNMVELRDFLIVRNQPAATYGSSWTPNSDDFDIDFSTTSGRVYGVEVLRSKNFIRIRNNVGNYVQIDDIRGQVFDVGVQVLSALDSVEIGRIHFWPYWTGGPGITSAIPVLLYQLANHYGVHALRADGLNIENLFTFAARATVLLDKNPATDGTGGVVNNGTFGKIYNDNGAAAILVANTAVNAVFFRGNIIESYGAPRTAKNPQGQDAPFYTGELSIIDSVATNSHINVSQMWSNNASASHIRQQGSNTTIEVSTLIEGSWNGCGKSYEGVYANNSRVNIASWQKADGTTNPFSNFPINGQRFATAGSGVVSGVLSKGTITVTTDANGSAFWPHNAGGSVPRFARCAIIDPGAGLAATARFGGMDGTNVAFVFTNAAGAPIASRSDIRVFFETFSGA